MLNKGHTAAYVAGIVDECSILEVTGGEAILRVRVSARNCEVALGPRGPFYARNLSGRWWLMTGMFAKNFLEWVLPYLTRNRARAEELLQAWDTIQNARKDYRETVDRARQLSPLKC